MKYLVTKQGVFAVTLYAVVALDGSVFWQPQRVKATRVTQERATDIKQRYPQATLQEVE